MALDSQLRKRKLEFQTETEPAANMDRVRSWLADNIVGNAGLMSIVHGDFRLDNMIFTPRRPDVAAV